MQTQNEVANKETQKRQIARIVRISDLVSGEYVQQSGWLPNFVRTINGVEASRVNIIGILTDISPSEIIPFVATEQFSAMIDDGSAKMQLRSFEPITFAEELTVGMPVVVIARPKKYSGELFLVPEIIRKLSDKKLLEVRKIILDGQDKNRKTVKQDVESKKTEPVKSTKTIEEKKIVVEEAEDDSASEKADVTKPSENVLDIINRLDSGNGVSMQLVIAELKVVRPEINGEQRIQALLMSGDIFEMKPGIIKVLK